MPEAERDPVQPRLRETAAQARETPASAAHASPNAEPGWRRWLRNIAIAAAAGVFLALVGAMGTAQASLPMRLMYWLPLMIGGSVVGHFVSVVVARIPRASASPWIFGGLLALAVSIPLTVLVWAYTSLLSPSPLPVGQLPGFFVGVLVISVGMTAVMMLASQPGRVTHAPAEGEPSVQVRFLERLPAKLKGAKLYAVSAEDHYLRLHTSKGSDLILMRLGDAISELEGLEGAQTHRSWWVAKEAVRGVRREGERMTLLLPDSMEAPVSRPNVRALRERGWF